MIRFKIKPEPENFDRDVRQRGKDFLKKTPCPDNNQFKNHAYWQIVLPDLRREFRGICAYSAFYIHSVHCAGSVDHFIPKSKKPELAYEWSNYRYSSSRFNTIKGEHKVIDPFVIGCDWLLMEFPSLLIKLNPVALLSDELKEELLHTINVFKWNDRQKYRHYYDYSYSCLKNYCTGQWTFKALKHDAPFIAYQLIRQKKKEMIKTIMDFSKTKEEG